MSSIESQVEGAPEVNFLPGFALWCVLWQGENPICPSEFSARWTVRKHRAELVKAQAIAVHRGRQMVHLERFVQVIERAALAASAH